MLLAPLDDQIISALEITTDFLFTEICSRGEPAMHHLRKMLDAMLDPKGRLKVRILTLRLIH